MAQLVLDGGVWVSSVPSAGGNIVEKTSDDLLWADLQAGSYSDGDLFFNTTSGAVYSAQCTSESFGGVLVPAAWAGYSNIRLQTSTAPWPSLLDVSYGSDPRASSTVGKGYMLKSDSLADLHARGWGSETWGVADSPAKTAGANLILNSKQTGQWNRSMFGFMNSEREAGWATSPSYTGTTRQILAIRSKSFDFYDNDGRGPHILMYGLADDNPIHGYSTYLTPNRGGGGVQWLARFNAYGSDISSDGGYECARTVTGDVWIYCLLDLGLYAANPLQAGQVEGVDLHRGFTGLTYPRNDMNTFSDTAAAGLAAYAMLGCYGRSGGPNAWEIEQAYFLTMDAQ